MFSDNTEELAQNKLILLYIIENSPHFFDKNELSEYILEKNYINFFLIKQYLSELIQGNLIELIEDEDKHKYVILEKGTLALEYFDSKIPQNIKNELKEDFEAFSYVQEKDRQVISEYFLKEDNEYMVNLKLVENEETLFSIYMSVPSIEQAKDICEKWKVDTQNIYKNIVNLFI
ncbi:MAG: DUF4364 family protein [Tissierella sp.]|uniref:DUF4364 family protein n=1 Tax=Tissierella sp. TaxID=41274 RepID=UPI003F9CCD5E